MAAIKRFLVFVIIITLVAGWVGFHFKLIKIRHGSIVFNTRIHKAAGTYLDNCPMEGSATEDRLQELNKLKNRDYFPTDQDFDKEVTTQLLLRPGDDLDRWDDNSAAEISGYVAGVKTSEPESCNCGSKAPDHRDTHIELVLEPMIGSNVKSVIVEVSPRLRQIMAGRGVDWSTRVLRDKILGRWVKVQGWLMFDEEHTGQAENTNPNGSRNWRGTCWEIHPITSIEIIDRPL